MENEAHKSGRTEKGVAMETGTDEDDRTTEPVSVDTSETETISLEGDGVSVKSQESSTVPKRSSSGSSTPCDKRSLSPAPGASKHTPHSGASRSGRASQDVIQSPEMHPNRPNRPGIIWTVNGKLEAMDFQKKWYPARIVDMDDTDNTVLIHFDGWNQRYDEWVTMDSERLRPLTRTSGRKDKKTTKKSSAKLFTGCLETNDINVVVLKPAFEAAHDRLEPSSDEEHKVGDNVFAKWTDCRMYAGTVVAITPNESYEVLFYDGFKKTVQPINVKSMPLHVQKEYAVAGILPHPSSRPHQKLQMLEKKTMSDDYKRAFKQTKFAKKAPRAGGQSADELTSRTHKATSSISSPETPSPQLIKSTKMRFDKLKRRHKHKIMEDSPPMKKAKLVVGGKFQVKKLKSHVGRFDVKERRIRMKKSEVREQKKVNRKQCILNLKSRKGFKSAAGRCRTRKRGYNLSKTLYPKSESVPVEESKVTTDKTDQVEQGTTGRGLQVDSPAPCTGSSTSHDIKKEDELSDDDISLAELIKSPAPASTNSQETIITTSSDTTPTVVKATKHVKQTAQVSNHDPEPVLTLQPKKAFLATPEEKFTCPFENCNKSFRKTKFVECHIKYYHTTEGNVVQTQPPRKRRKTSSICSSDSEVSLPVKQVKKRKESSLPVIQSSEATVNTPDVNTVEEGAKQEVSQVTSADVAAEHKQKDTTAGDYSCDVTADVSADCLSKDEVVNCICQLNEENGLMIQCETCLCWQHAVCMELTEETLPAKYMCYVCTNPPGIRESARYSYDQDWLKQGTMARFKFLPEDPHLKQKSQIMLATHNLVSDLHGVNRVLSSLKCQLHANKDKNHPEVKFWVKNWDKVMEEEELSRQLARAKSQAAVSLHKTGEKTSESLTEVNINLDQDKSDQSPDVKHKLTVGNLGLCPDNVKQDPAGKQDLIESNKTQIVSDENPPIKEEISKEQGVTDGKPSVKDDEGKRETDPGKLEIKQEVVKGQKDEENLDVKAGEPSIKQEIGTDVCSGSAFESLSTSTSLSEKQTSSHGQSSDKSEILKQHGSRVNESDVSGCVATSSLLGSEKQITLSENLSSSSLSSLNEDSVSKTNTQNLPSQDPNQNKAVVTVQEQPFISCEHNLLEHICFMQDNVESRLDLIEEQISVLEKADDNSNGSGAHDGDVLRDVPRVKKAIHQILDDLFKVKRMALYR